MSGGRQERPRTYGRHTDAPAGRPIHPPGNPATNPAPVRSAPSTGARRGRAQQNGVRRALLLGLSGLTLLGAVGLVAGLRASGTTGSRPDAGRQGAPATNGAPLAPPAPRPPARVVRAASAPEALTWQDIDVVRADGPVRRLALRDGSTLVLDADTLARLPAPVRWQLEYRPLRPQERRARGADVWRPGPPPNVAGRAPGSAPRPGGDP